jgi:hypothetical protein
LFCILVFRGSVSEWFKVLAWKNKFTLSSKLLKK